METILAAGARTPFGDFGGSLKGIPLSDLGAHAARASLQKSGLRPEQVDHLVFGHTLSPDSDAVFVARVVALKAAMSESSSALSVSRACGSGLQAIISASLQMSGGHSRIALAGGGECFSRAPHVVSTARWGVKRGPQTMVDMLDWAYRCPLSGELMGDTAENLAADFGYRREEMDEWALMSQQRARRGIESGFLGRQIVPIEVRDGKTARLLCVDEFPRPHVTREKLSSLRPAFRAGGCVTAGNSSGVTDGAAFVVVAVAEAAHSAGIEPEARILDWTCVGVPPRIMGCGPVPAIRKLLDRSGLSVDDIDYFEINEAFAVVNLHTERELRIPRERTNLYGGGISIGHPPGATGVRMTITAMHHLQESGGHRAVISLCLGAGQGMAMLIERIAS
jgi:acetyl-CoA acetyltransferase family protein